MKSNSPGHEKSVARLLELLVTIGRRSSLRDPLSMALEDTGLTAAQLHAVLWLGRDAPLTMGGLAQRIGVTEKTITGVVDRLEKARLATRARATGDRRVVHVVPTQSGRALYVKVEGDIIQKLGSFLKLLDAQDRKDLFRILQHVSDRLEAGPSQEDHR